MSYIKINWEDYPSVKTPINADNLNHMDNGISQLSEQMNDISSISNPEIDEIVQIKSDGEIDIDAEEIDQDEIDSLF